jgi:acyl-homoserine-lactone acylase
MSIHRWLSLTTLLYLTGCGYGAAAAPEGGAQERGGVQGVQKEVAPITAPLDVEIRWTSYGIPHVRANDRASLGYGFAYATARDAVCVIAREVLKVNGELSRHFGGTDGNLASDIFHKAVLNEARVAAFLDAEAPAVAAFSRGYVAGYNRYLRDHPQSLPASCADAEWLRPMTGADLARLTIGVGIRYGLGRYLRETAAATPPGRASAQAVTTDFAAPEAHGSNAVALGRALTESGHGMLLGNPHYPWHGPSRFHLIHTTIPGELDVMGVSLLTTTRVGIGFNRDVAWTHNVSTATRATLYELALHPRNPLRYRYGSGYRDMEVMTVEVDELAADGSLSTGQHQVYLTHYGPVVASRQLPWTGTKAYAVRDVNLDNDHAAATYDALHRATSVDEVEAALSLQGAPWTSTIAADRHGTAFFGDLSVTPNVDAPQFYACRVEVEGVPDRVVVFDGSDPDCEWRVDERAAVPGAMPADDMPRLKRDDYVANSNDSHWIANPEEPLEGYSPIIGAERTQLSLRTRAGFTFLQEHLETRRSFVPEDLQRMLYDHRNYAAELLLDDVLLLCSGAAGIELHGHPVDVTAACAALADWDRRMTVDSRGGHVWREFWREVRDGEYLFAVPFLVSNPVETPRHLSLANEEVREDLLRALAQAQARLRANGIPLDAPLRDIQYVESNGERLPIPGGEGWAGMWSLISSALTPAGYTPIRSGNSYIQVVSWDDDGELEAHGMLTYSQSPEPDSPHHSDLTRLYASGQWITLPFSEADIVADPNLEILRLREDP